MRAVLVVTQLAMRFAHAARQVLRREAGVRGAQAARDGFDRTARGLGAVGMAAGTEIFDIFITLR